STIDGADRRVLATQMNLQTELVADSSFAFSAGGNYVLTRVNVDAQDTSTQTGLIVLPNHTYRGLALGRARVYARATDHTGQIQKLVACPRSGASCGASPLVLADSLATGYVTGVASDGSTVFFATWGTSFDPVDGALYACDAAKGCSPRTNPAPLFTI